MRVRARSARRTRLRRESPTAFSLGIQRFWRIRQFRNLFRAQFTHDGFAGKSVVKCAVQRFHVYACLNPYTRQVPLVNVVDAGISLMPSYEVALELFAVQKSGYA